MIKDMIVHLDGSPDDRIAIAHAQRISSWFDAQITGLYSNVLPELPLAAAEVSMAPLLVAEDEDTARKEGSRKAVELKRQLETASPSAELIQTDLFHGELWHSIARQARLADLFIALRPYAPRAEPLRTDILEAALFGGGSGVLVVSEPPREGPLKTAMVAWNGSRESARAVAVALPLLKKAQRVIIAAVDGRGSETQDEHASLTAFSRHLLRHGVEADLRSLSGSGTISDLLLRESERLEAGLVVMGGYGHSRFREWVLGGTTRDFLLRCPIPMLMAH